MAKQRDAMASENDRNVVVFCICTVEIPHSLRIQDLKESSTNIEKKKLQSPTEHEDKKKL